MRFFAGVAALLHTAEFIRGLLVPFLLISASLLALLLVYLFVRRAVCDLKAKRHRTLVARYQPVVDEITSSGLTPQVCDRLQGTPASHRRILAGLLLAPLHVARGDDLVSHARDAAVALGLVEQWHADLAHRHWWRRADGIRALGFVEDRSAVTGIVRALDDDHEEVRAAALDAAGRLGDPRAIPALLGHLADGSRYQRARVIDALRSLGPQVTPALVELARMNPEHAHLAADVLGLIGTTAAIDPLLQWCGDARSDVRAAALAALGSIGLDDRSYYFALRALGDADPQARAMAARALGRGRREDAVAYLADRLDDEWLPAAQAAEALRRLGGAGLAALEARAQDEGQAGDLARQMLWTQPSSVAPA